MKIEESANISKQASNIDTLFHFYLLFRNSSKTVKRESSVPATRNELPCRNSAVRADETVSNERLCTRSILRMGSIAYPRASAAAYFSARREAAAFVSRRSCNPCVRRNYHRPN